MANPVRIDPTRTGAIRRKFESTMRKRFKWLRSAISDLVDGEDAFGLKPSTIKGQVQGSRAPGPTTLLNQRFAFETNEDKVKQFREWLRNKINEGVLEAEAGVSPENAWLSEFIHSAYRKGRVNAALAAGALATTEEGFLRQAFNSPETVRKLQYLSTRAYENLQGITSDMSRKIADVLATGLAQGLDAKKIARNMVAEVDTMSRRRAETLARTEIIRAHAEAQLDEFEALNIHELTIMAEWVTAADSRVCPLCAPLDSQVFTIEEARGLIPRHPNCRCAWVPANVGERRARLSATLTRTAVKKSVQAEKPKKTYRKAKAESQWPGADVKITRRPKKG